MKNWTVKDERSYQVLMEKKQVAFSALSDDLKAMLGKDGTYGDILIYLGDNGQKVLDVLLKHFDPSPINVVMPAKYPPATPAVHSAPTNAPAPPCVVSDIAPTLEMITFMERWKMCWYRVGSTKQNKFLQPPNDEVNLAYRILGEIISMTNWRALCAPLSPMEVRADFERVWKTVTRVKYDEVWIWEYQR